MSAVGKAWLVWLGILVVLIADAILVPAALATRSANFLPLGIAFGAAIALIAALAGFVLKWRAFALGLAGGYILLTLFTGGVCTLLTADTELSSDFGALAVGGLLLLLLGMGLAFVVLGIISIVKLFSR